jgi:hypothetical protein
MMGIYCLLLSGESLYNPHYFRESIPDEDEAKTFRTKYSIISY